MTDSKTHLTNPAIWIRLAFMLVFALLLTGSDNENLRNLGQGLGKWIYQAFMFLTFNSEEKPFPFDEWPTIDPSEGYSVKSADDIEEGEFVDAQEPDDVPSFSASEDIEQASENLDNRDS